jgi:hypothetical protein
MASSEGARDTGDFINRTVTGWFSGMWKALKMQHGDHAMILFGRSVGATTVHALLPPAASHLFRCEYMLLTD